MLVHLPGGDLELEWAENNHVYMTGEAVEVFSGEWNRDWMLMIVDCTIAACGFTLSTAC